LLRAPITRLLQITCFFLSYAAITCPSTSRHTPPIPSSPSKSAGVVSAHQRAETVRRTADIGGGVRKYENYGGVSNVHGACSVLDKSDIERSNLIASRLQLRDVVGWDMLVGGCGVEDLDSLLGSRMPGIMWGSVGEARDVARVANWLKAN